MHSSKLLRVLAVLVVVGFVLLLIFGFDNMLGLLRSRVAIFLALLPLVVLFCWSLYKAIPRRGKHREDVIDITPPRK